MLPLPRDNTTIEGSHSPTSLRPGGPLSLGTPNYTPPKHTCMQGRRQQGCGELEPGWSPVRLSSSPQAPWPTLPSTTLLLPHSPTHCVRPAQVRTHHHMSHTHTPHSLRKPLPSPKTNVHLSPSWLQRHAQELLPCVLLRESVMATLPPSCVGYPRNQSLQWHSLQH